MPVFLDPKDKPRDDGVYLCRGMTVYCVKLGGLPRPFRVSDDDMILSPFAVKITF